MNPIRFALWLEKTDAGRPFVFMDLDETLVHNLEIGWLKDSPQNKDFAKLVVPGEHPYPDVKKIRAEGKEMFVFPRPGATRFLKAVNEFADLYVLTHSRIDYAHKVVEVMGWGKYFKDCFSTGDTKPGQLGDKFKLADKNWLLIDNLDIHSIEVVNKLRILGLGGDAVEAKKVARQVARESEPHFIDVEDWVPTTDEYDDYELWKTLPKVKKKLGLRNDP